MVENAVLKTQNIKGIGKLWMGGGGFWILSNAFYPNLLLAYNANTFGLFRLGLNNFHKKQLAISNNALLMLPNCHS